MMSRRPGVAREARDNMKRSRVQRWSSLFPLVRLFLVVVCTLPNTCFVLSLLSFLLFLLSFLGFFSSLRLSSTFLFSDFVNFRRSVF